MTANDRQYVVIRQWQTSKRTYRIAVGPYSSWKAQQVLRRAREEYNRDHLFIALFRPPNGHADEVELYL
jgi:hypothetical protein